MGLAGGVEEVGEVGVGEGFGGAGGADAAAGEKLGEGLKGFVRAVFGMK